MHLEFVKEMPHETKLIVSTCPAYLWGRSSQSDLSGRSRRRSLKPQAEGPGPHLRRQFRSLRERIRSYLTKCLSAGIKSGEFRKLPVSETANVLMALINGFIRLRRTGPPAESQTRRFKRGEGGGDLFLQVKFG